MVFTLKESQKNTVVMPMIVNMKLLLNSLGPSLLASF